MVYIPSLKDNTAITYGAVVSMTMSLFTVRLPSSPEAGRVVIASCSSGRCGAGLANGYDFFRRLDLPCCRLGLVALPYPVIFRRENCIYFESHVKQLRLTDTCLLVETAALIFQPGLSLEKSPRTEIIHRNENNNDTECCAP